MCLFRVYPTGDIGYDVLRLKDTSPPTRPENDNQALSSNKAVGEAVHHLNLTGNHTRTLGELCTILDAASHLAPAIATLDLSDMHLEGLFLSVATDFIRRCNNLRRIDLSGNVVEDVAAAEALGLALADKAALNYINFSRAGLTGEVAAAFVRGLGQSAFTAKESQQQQQQAPVVGCVVHLTHNRLVAGFCDSVLRLVRGAASNRPTAARITGVSVFGNHVPRAEVEALASYCTSVRQTIEKALTSRSAAGKREALAPPSRPGTGTPSNRSGQKRSASALGYLARDVEDSTPVPEDGTRSPPKPGSSKSDFPVLESLAEMVETDQ